MSVSATSSGASRRVAASPSKITDTRSGWVLSEMVCNSSIADRSGELFARTEPRFSGGVRSLSSALCATANS